VLDQEYKRYSLIRLPEELAITRLLKATGDIGRGINTRAGFGKSTASLHAFASTLSRGLSHCLRWVCADCAPGEAVHGQNWRQEDDQATAFLHWGMRYALLATDHVAWSNSLIEATIDEGKKTIEFGPPKWMDAHYFKRQVEADLAWWRMELGECYPSKAFVGIFNDWQRHAEWRTHGLEFSPDFVRNHVRFPEMRAWITQVLFGMFGCL
jgi:hypothetical protein